jgi:predicted DNA-binding ribbon-helix-helix protein
MKNVQLPDDMYDRLEELASQDHVSVDRLVTMLVSERVSEWSRLRGRAARGSVEKLQQVLAKVSDVPAEAADRI